MQSCLDHEHVVPERVPLDEHLPTLEHDTVALVVNATVVGVAEMLQVLSKRAAKALQSARVFV